MDSSSSSGNKRKRGEDEKSSEIDLVVQEVQAIREAVRVLHTRLQAKKGYPSVVGVWPCVDESMVDKLESKLKKKVPLILKLFWLHVGGISLVDLKQHHTASKR